MKFEQYQNKYKHFKFERTEDGILTWRFHTDDGPLTWCARSIRDVGPALQDIAHDRENNVLILTGTGDEMIGKIEFGNAGLGKDGSGERTFPLEFTASSGGFSNLDSLFAMHIPIIAAVNGPMRVHSELAVLSDIVLATPNALFQDLPHFMSGLVPGDGINMTWQMLIGPNRARYFLWTGQEIHAEEAYKLGVVNEIVEPGKLLDRAHELARHLMRQSKLVRKHTRQMLIRNIKMAHAEEAALGGMLELSAWTLHGPPADLLPEPKKA